MKPSVTAAQPTTRDLPDVISEEFAALLRSHGVTEAYLFGSTTNGTAGPESDVDVLVKFDRTVELFDQFRLADQLQEICGRPVDLMTDIHPAFAPYIIPTLVPIPV
jgi:predicted nucleotidyltransferase